MKNALSILAFIIFSLYPHNGVAQSKIANFTYGDGVNLYLYKINVFDTVANTLTPSLKLEVQTNSLDTWGNTEIQNFVFYYSANDIVKMLELSKKYIGSKKEIPEYKLSNGSLVKFYEANGEKIIGFELQPEVPALVFTFYQSDFLNLTTTIQNILSQLKQ